MEYRLIRSKRKTLSLSLDDSGTPVVRAPMRAPKKEIETFIEKHLEWIERQKEKFSEKEKQTAQLEPIGQEEIAQLIKQAREYIPQRVRHFAPMAGVTYGRITVRHQTSRWGSCSSKGNLNFNCLLMLMPKEVIDAVVVHELCHRKEMNHSKKFYAEVTRVYPAYQKWNEYLKKNGQTLILRMKKGKVTEKRR